jgi:hypothetical protein
MKKKYYVFLLLCLAFGAFSFIACNEEEELDAITIDDLIATWTTNSTDNNYVVVFTKDQVTFKVDGAVDYQGSYTFNNNVVSISGENGNEIKSVPGLLYDKSVLVLKYIYKNDNGSEENLAFVLFKQGKTVTATVDDIQGFWCWYSDFGDDEIIRTAIKIDKNKFELTITPWGQRYTGTFTYKNGFIHLNTTNGFTSREEGTGYGELWGRMDPKTLECSDWRTLDKEYWTVDAVSDNPFIANGDEAYGFVANIPSIMKKKK